MEIGLGVFFISSLFFRFVLVLGVLMLGVLIRNKFKIQPKLDAHNNTGNFSGLFKKL